MKEIQENYPIHDENQRVFGLPTRTVAKVFIYRIIFSDAFGDRGFGGPAYAYANDADFSGTSTSPKFWESVIEKFFEKYPGVYQHSLNLIKTAQQDGKIVSPSGRFYLYKYGPKGWPHTQILNHIVQGLSADFVMIARRLLFLRLKEYPEYMTKILPQNTIHDSVEVDLDHRFDKGKELCYNTLKEMERAFSDIPRYFEKNYGTVVNVPMAAEAKFGFSMYEPDMIKFNSETFSEDFDKLCSFKSK